MSDQTPPPEITSSLENFKSNLMAILMELFNSSRDTETSMKFLDLFKPENIVKSGTDYLLGTIDIFQTESVHETLLKYITLIDILKKTFNNLSIYRKQSNTNTIPTTPFIITLNQTNLLLLFAILQEIFPPNNENNHIRIIPIGSFTDANGDSIFQLKYVGNPNNDPTPNIDMES
jgi:hypothetical protein